MSIQIAFDNALLDIAEITNDKQKTNIEQWYEVIKKVMKMWESQNGKEGHAKTSEADDFYVFMYDEDEKTKMKQRGKQL